MNQIQQKYVVLSGGPCAGKTSAVERMKHDLSRSGWLVLVVPETATELLGTGLFPGANISNYDFQEMLFGLQLNKENMIRNYLGRIVQRLPESAKGILVIFDRGLQDGSAYISKDEYEKICSAFHMDQNEIIERYDAVFYLESAASKAREFYSAQTNKSRYETADQAEEVDKKTLQAWKSHPQLHIIFSRESFESKMDELMRSLLGFLEKN